jgi:hypothetical protein
LLEETSVKGEKLPVASIFFSGFEVTDKIIKKLGSSGEYYTDILEDLKKLHGKASEIIIKNREEKRRIRFAEKGKPLGGKEPFIEGKEPFEGKEGERPPSPGKKPVVVKLEIVAEQKQFVKKKPFGLSFRDLLDGRLVTKSEFEQVRTEFLATYRDGEKDGARAIKKIIPFDSKVAIHADFHGDKYSMYAYLKDLVEKGYLEKDNPFKIREDKKIFIWYF